MMPPQNKAVSEIATETGIPEVTLYKWRRKGRECGFAVPSGQTKSERWSTQDKFRVVLETAALSETELAKYCREKGLYVEKIKAWYNYEHKHNGIKCITPAQRHNEQCDSVWV